MRPTNICRSTNLDVLAIGMLTTYLLVGRDADEPRYIR